MKRISKVLLTLMLATTTSITLAACGNKKDEEKEIDPNSITGHVVYLSPDSQLETTQKIIDEFLKVYTNVTVDVQPYPGTWVHDELTARAATGDLPHIVESVADINYPLSQGWVYPLDEFIEGDKDFEYVAENLYKDLIRNGKLYAMPYKLNFSGIFVNMDLLEKLNMDPPDYEWTIDDYVEMAKKATNNTYSGIAGMGEYDREMVGIFSKDGAEWNYNSKEEKFNFTNGGFEKAYTFKKDLLAVPGLVASTLQNQKIRDEGKEDDYQKKFGKEVDGFKDGKILFNPTGLWYSENYDGIFNYDYYPLPHDPEVGYKEATHANFIYMTTEVDDENKQATFELIKWLTYSVPGNKARFEVRSKIENPIPGVFIPVSTHPEIQKGVNELDLPEGVKYMYKNVDRGYRADLYKSIPGMKQAIDQVIQPKMWEVTAGDVEPSVIGAELEEKTNTILKEAKEQLEQQMKEFDKTEESN